MMIVPARMKVHLALGQTDIRKDYNGRVGSAAGEASSPSRPKPLHLGGISSERRKPRAARSQRPKASNRRPYLC
jgi:hypothetical protein